MLILLLQNTSRVVSDEPDILVIIFNNKVLTQADCPRVIDIFTAEVYKPASIQFQVEEFPASSEVFMSTNNTNKMANKNCIFSTVQPVPAPCSTNELANNNINEGGNNQNDILFNLGKAISGAPM